MPNLNDVFKNKLFLQYLSAAGSDIAAGRPISQNVNAVTQQNIQTQNFNKLLTAMLRDGASPDRMSKVTFDGDSLNYKVDLKGERDKRTASGEGERATSQSPFNVSGGDLAGLTPEMISQALKFKMDQEAVERQKINDIVNNIYKSALTKQALHAANAPYTDTRTSDIKNYEYAVKQGFDGTLKDWKTTDTADWKDYQKAKGEGYEGNFYKWQKEMAALSGGLSLEEFGARKEITEDVERKSTVRSPEFAQTVTEDLMKNKGGWYSVEEADKLATEKNISFEQAQLMIQRRNVLNEMGRRVRAAFKGKKVEARADGWYVNGKLEVRNPYAK